MNTCVKSVFSLPSVQAMQEKEAKAEAIQVRRVPLPQVLREVGVLEGRMFWTPIKERKGKEGKVHMDLYPPTQAAGP